MDQNKHNKQAPDTGNPTPSPLKTKTTKRDNTYYNIKINSNTIRQILQTTKQNKQQKTKAKTQQKLYATQRKLSKAVYM